MLIGIQFDRAQDVQTSATSSSVCAMRFSDSMDDAVSPPAESQRRIQAHCHPQQSPKGELQAMSNTTSIEAGTTSALNSTSLNQSSLTVGITDYTMTRQDDHQQAARTTTNNHDNVGHRLFNSTLAFTHASAPTFFPPS